MSIWRWKVRFNTLWCWVLLAFAAPAQAEPADAIQGLPASAVQVAPASGVQAAPTPAEDYEAGDKAEKKGDLIGAMALFERSAKAGYVPAQARYADTLRKGQAQAEAHKYYRMSVQQGDRDGQYGLGLMYELGEGVKRDPGVARFLYGLAAEQGHVEASYKMASAYIKGTLGIAEADKESPEALLWIRRAAGHNYLPALDALAAAYREGKFGITPDPVQADVIVAKSNKLRGIEVKVKEKSALYKFLKGDPEKK